MWSLRCYITTHLSKAEREKNRVVKFIGKLLSLFLCSGSYCGKQNLTQHCPSDCSNPDDTVHLIRYSMTYFSLKQLQHSTASASLNFFPRCWKCSFTFSSLIENHFRFLLLATYIVIYSRTLEKKEKLFHAFLAKNNENNWMRFD